MPRNLTILKPKSQPEFWFTERVFEVGDTYKRDGETWVVTSLAGTDTTTGKHSLMTVRLDEEA